MDDDVVVLDLRTSSYLRVNGTGAVLWNLLRRPRTGTDLEAALVERYGIAHDRARADVRGFLQALARRQLLST